ncbi:MAG: hypothetical protein K940chlam1_00582 [Candidatus Anoxychlamydiales bacterium]|nr:hypothetical protein [Candidatus Anoxychlamydiales bacterium]NGX36405.1 hypothetical protein [Candidatus Anoxychlamydiales bacterium]
MKVLFKLRKIYFLITISIQLISFSIFAENVTFSTPQIVAADGNRPQIATDISGRYVYVIEFEGAGLTGPTKIFISSDFGVNFSSATGAFGTGFNPQIITDISGRYIFATWSDGATNIKIFFSLNFGLSWIDVDSSNTTFGLGGAPQIITDSVSRNIYGIWADSSDPIDLTRGLRSFFPIRGLKINR